MKLTDSRDHDRGEVEFPERFDPVTVVRPSGERVQARVSGRDGETFEVTLTFRAEEPLNEGPLDKLTLEFTSPSGRVRLQGTTVTLVESELLRFDGVRAAEVVQQREYVRVRAARPVVVLMSGCADEVQTYSVDLSGGGMLLAGPSTLKIGTQVEFRLTTEKGSPPINGVGTVVRADPEGRRAICFDEIGAGEHRRLVRFIFECQRAERRRGLEESSHGR
jgi:PilZ domain